MSDQESGPAPEFATSAPIRIVREPPDVEAEPRIQADTDAQRYEGTLRRVRERIQAADRIMDAARDRANGELVAAGRVILEREFGDDAGTYRTSGAQGGVFERLSGDVERAPTTLRTWVEAAIVERRLGPKIQAPKSSLSMTHLLELANLDDDENAQVEVALECIKHGWSTRALRREVAAKRAQLSLKPRRKRRKSKEGSGEAPRLQGHEPTPEDLQALYEVVTDRLAQRAESDRRAAVEAMLEIVKRRLDRDRGVQATGSVAALHREFTRVYNRVNASRAPDGRTDDFRAVVGPGPLVTVRLGSWKRCCEPEQLRKALGAIRDVADSPNEQVVAALTEATGTLSDKFREVRNAVELVAERTWK